MAAQLTVTKGVVPAGTLVVEGVGDELLARARLAEEQDRGVDGRHLLQHRQGVPQRRAAAHDLLVLTDSADLLAQVEVLLLDPLLELHDLRDPLAEGLLGPFPVDGAGEDLPDRAHPLDHQIGPLEVPPTVRRARAHAILPPSSMGTASMDLASQLWRYRRSSSASGGSCLIASERRTVSPLRRVLWYQDPVSLTAISEVKRALGDAELVQE